MINLHDPEAMKVEKEYHLTCKVIAKEITYDDEQSKGITKVTELLVFLVPKQGSETDRFFDAWLPSGLERLPDGRIVGDEFYEIATRLAYPVNGPCRMSVHRRDERMNEHYLFVMTRAAEEDLKHMNGKFVNVTVLPASGEAILDKTRDYELSNNVNR